MTKKHSTKKALLASALSLLLCVSMLVGTTFAWFTDSVTSANNIIMSGNLDVALEYSTDMVNWTAVDANTNIFDDEARWEPGYTEVVYLRVSNLGSLAMKYKLGVNVASETEGKTRDNNTPFKLSNYIEYGIVEDVTAAYGADDRMTARADIGTASKLNAAYSEEFHLVGKTATATDTDVYALVVYMPESVGNEANHNGTDIPVINLGLSVLATQDTVESDSFNNQYDQNAQLPAVDNEIKDGSNPVVLYADGVEIVIPANASAGLYNVCVSNKNRNTDADGNTTLSLDIHLTKDGKKVEADGSVYYRVNVEVATGMTIVGVTHNGQAIGYEYDAQTGIVSFTTNSFSPFAITYFEDDTVNVDMSTVSAVLKENDWETIRAVIKAGKVEEAGWKVGDESPTFTCDGKTCKAMIIGIDQDGENTVTFMIKEAVGSYKMYDLWTNEGGFKESIVNEFMDELEEKISIAEYMLPVDKACYYEVFSSDEYKVGTDSGKLFLLSLKEIGAMDEAENYGYRYLDVLEKESSFVYTYFQTDDAQKREDIYWYGKNDVYWLRSAATDSTVAFFAVDSSGDLVGKGANTTNDVIPAFVIG